MRIDLSSGGRRPWFIGVVLSLARWWMGVDSGPPTAISYRPDLFGRDAIRYLQSAHASPGWSRGELEMFSAFVSKLNSCSF
ncbi:MAG: hypothetical protein AAF799_26085 [Myxococcota bacterium]